MIDGSLRERATGSGRGLALLLGAALLVVMVGNAHGGYYPTSWGWTVLAVGWVALMALVLTPHLAFARLALACLACLALLVGWTALSAVWSSDVEQTVLEAQRAMVYLTCVLAALAVVRRHLGYLLGGLVLGTTWLATKALGDRLSPGAEPGIDAIFQDRLSGALGYSNGLGLLCVMGALLALSFAVHGRPLAVRAAAGAALPILLTTAYFTYSRGAVLALAGGLVATVLLDRRRLTLLTAGLLVALPPAAAVWIGSQMTALTSARASPASIAAEGSDFTLVLLALTLASAGIALAIGLLEARIRVPRRVRRTYAIGLACAAAALVVGAVIHYGGPAPLVDTAYKSINRDAPSTSDQNDLNRRLGGIGSTARINYWRVAWNQYEEHPVVGAGAGTFEQFWQRDRAVDESARDAHSLYLETLAQLGWVGLILLVTMLVLPMLAAVRTSGGPVIVGAFGAYVAYVVHTGIDWDWEMPVVTLFALLCAVVLVAAHGNEVSARWRLALGWRAAAVAATLLIVALSIIGLVGTRALAQARESVDQANYRAGAEAAERAVRWAPWSAESLATRGRARLGLGREEEGRADLREAVRMNPRDWRLWYYLGVASTGREREMAFVRAARLNPRQTDIVVLRERGYRLPGTRAPR